MYSTSHSITSLFRYSYAVINQPIVKEGVKNLASSISFMFGLVEMHDIYRIAKGRSITCEALTDAIPWKQQLYKIIMICAKISLVLSAGVSRPGIYLISTLMGSIFSTSQLNRVFGPNTVFEINPWHPRHIVSIAALIFALPCVIQSAYCSLDLFQKNIRHCCHKSEFKAWLCDKKINVMVLFNTLTSRPILHLGNQIFRFALISK